MLVISFSSESVSRDILVIQSYNLEQNASEKFTISNKKGLSMECLLAILFQLSSATAKNFVSGVRLGPPILDKNKVDKKYPISI